MKRVVIHIFSRYMRYRGGSGSICALDIKILCLTTGVPAAFENFAEVCLRVIKEGGGDFFLQYALTAGGFLANTSPHEKS
ncbi:hypothetical protein [Agrobacterium tumefaciens]|uniref:hypothetical protein n=1 Tax=Agrobacterium tumefaciens TaxID=358 RepID=UPI0027D83B22|nr:hypothetical protein [Agrobacterium tumefaciens]